MNNNISESQCSFEVSKLLKEKGFDIIGNSHYTPDTKIQMDSIWFHDHTRKYHHGEIPCPTHALAIEWIRKNFSIHIYTTPQAQSTSGEGFAPDGKWSGNIDDCTIGKEMFNTDTLGFVSPFNSTQEAVEAALLYTLQNLIKLEK